MLTVTILIYSVFTGLSFFSHSWFDFTACRFLTGLGVGGVFGLAVALIAETVPPAPACSRSACSRCFPPIGNVAGGLHQDGARRARSLQRSRPARAGVGCSSSAPCPAMMVILTGKYLREPESWLALKAAGPAQGEHLRSLPQPARVPSLAQEPHRRRTDRLDRRRSASGRSASTRSIFRSRVFTQLLRRPGRRREFAAADVASRASSTPRSHRLLPQHARRRRRHVALHQARRRDRPPHRLRDRLLHLAGRDRLRLLEDETPTDAYWMMPLMGAAQLGALRRVRHLPARAVPRQPPQHRHQLLLQPRPLRRRRRQLLLRLPHHALRHRRPNLRAPPPLQRHHDVRHLPPRPLHTSLRPRDTRPAAARGRRRQPQPVPPVSPSSPPRAAPRAARQAISSDF